MEIQTAQKEVRTTFIGGFIGQLVSSVLWALSAGLSTWHSRRAGILALVFGGFFIFPAIQLTLRFMKRPHSLPRTNPMNQLAMQVAFTLPLALPVVAAAVLYRPNWFYPAFMIVLGAHYLPFAFLYGMRMFIPLCGMLVTIGLMIGIYLPASATLGAWITSALLFVFAIVGRQTVLSEHRQTA